MKLQAAASPCLPIPVVSKKNQPADQKKGSGQNLQGIAILQGHRQRESENDPSEVGADVWNPRFHEGIRRRQPTAVKNPDHHLAAVKDLDRHLAAVKNRHRKSAAMHLHGRHLPSTGVNPKKPNIEAIKTAGTIETVHLLTNDSFMSQCFKNNVHNKSSDPYKNELISVNSHSI